MVVLIMHFVIICTLCDLLKMDEEATETCLWIVIYDETHFADIHLVVHNIT
jgi:hypothetical protein